MDSILLGWVTLNLAIHSLPLAYAQVMRFFGFLSSNLVTKSFASGEMSSQDFSENDTSLVYILSSSILRLLLKKGGSPQSKTYMIHPKDHSSQV